MSKFKPVFLYQDTDWQKQFIELNNKKAEKLTVALEAVNQLFECKLSVKEIEQIFLSGWETVGEILRKDSQYKNADIETLLKLQGKISEPAKSVLEQNRHLFQVDSFKITKDKITVSEKAIENINERSRYYTKSEKQNAAFEIANTISEQLNKAIDLGIVYRHLENAPFKNILIYGKTPLGKDGFAPNYREIFRLT